MSTPAVEAAQPRALVAEDDEASRRGLARLIARWGWQVEEAADGEEAIDKATIFLPSVVVADLVMPRRDGLGVLAALRQELPFTAFIILTGHGTVSTAVDAMKQGAYDYLTKPVDVPRLKVLLEKALERGQALRELALLRRRLQGVWGFGRLVGTSAAIQEVFRLVQLAAPTPAAVLITGESGTGKELVAITLHELSPRRAGPFVAVNCSAIPETLLESEIFGHEKGAFTGAVESRPGCFELAHGGTIFLDEVAEMSPATQAKFLRVLEQGTVRRLGGRTEVKVDTRVVAATNKDPAKAMKDGALREDLYYRLNVFSIRLPALRARREDVPLLVAAFIEEFNARYDKRITAVDDAALRLLLEHDWPGNVRELRNTIERALIVCDGERIGPHHLPPMSGQGSTGSAEAVGGRMAVALGTRLAEAEKQLILRTLEFAGNNKTRAAEILGISVKTLHNKLARYRG